MTVQCMLAMRRIHSCVTALPCKEGLPHPPRHRLLHTSPKPSIPSSVAQLVYLGADDLDTITRLEKGSRAGAAAAVAGFACQPGCKRRKLLEYFGQRRCGAGVALFAFRRQSLTHACVEHASLRMHLQAGCHSLSLALNCSTDTAAAAAAAVPSPIRRAPGPPATQASRSCPATTAAPRQPCAAPRRSGRA